MCGQLYVLHLSRCGVLQEGDHILAINGQYLEGRTVEEVEQFIAESPVKMLLLVEFRVAGIMLQLTTLSSLFNLLLIWMDLRSKNAPLERSK